MKKLIVTGLAVLFVAGISAITMAKPVSDMDLDISGLAQLNYNWSEITNSNDELDTARLRLNFSAMPAEHVKVFSQIEGTDNTSAGAWGTNVPVDPNTSNSGIVVSEGAADSRIVDMYVDLTYIPEISARIGQFATPISYELNTNEYDLETINYTMGVGVFGVRDRGIMLFGQPIPEFGWQVFGMNGAGAITGASNDGDDQALYGLKLDWNPLENLSFKISGQTQKETLTSAQLAVFGLGFNYTYMGFRLTGEYNDANADLLTGSKDITEWYVHASYVIPETDLQLVLRYDKYDIDGQLGAAASVNDVDKHITTAGINWNFEKNARLQLMHEFVGGTGMGNQDSTDLMLGVRF